MKRKKIMLVFGTRPEAIKMCPLIRALKAEEGVFDTRVCVTGQHRQMLDSVLHTFGVVPDYDLKIMREHQDLFSITTAVLSGIREVFLKEKPDLVLVHGDTSTTFTTALAAFYLRIPVGHVEAGLRTYNLDSPYPEEFNRQAVSLVSRYHFAPTEAAKDNLLKEGKVAGSIYVTGNTGIDALKTTVSPAFTHPELTWACGSRLILLTAHRRENLGEPMRRMFRAIRRVLDEHPDVKAIYPIHMNPEVRRIAAGEFSGEDRIHLIEPLDVLDFHNFLARCDIVLTDSGGIQEEAPSLGKPVLVMRDTTERPEGVHAGTLKLTGTKEEDIYSAFSQLLNDRREYLRMAHASNPYGDGHASERIVRLLKEDLCADQAAKNDEGPET
jgi:UDP-N-acetylglucosamine 2-epimerase (non-hydrolysing)